MKIASYILTGLILASGPALALGPVDGEVGAVWWANEYDVSGDGGSITSDADAPGFRAELWFLQRYGVRAERYASEPDLALLDGADTSYTSLDFRWRALSLTENNYLALGVGWQQMSLDTIGLDGDTSGVRLGVDGRVALPGLFYVYGQGAYLPSLDDAPAIDPAMGRFEDLDGWEYEAGVAWNMAPFVSLRAGYRAQQLNFSQTGIEGLAPDTVYGGEANSEGFLLGLGIRF